MKKFDLYIIILIFCLFNFFKSFSSNDTIPTIVSWKLSKNYSEIQFNEIDTNLTRFQNYDFIKRISITSTSLGNSGLATMSNIFIYRKESPLFLFNTYSPYLFDNNNITFYNTRRHFTSLNYISNGSKTYGENWMNVIHTQNINPYINIGFNYKLISSVGQYQFQNSRDNSLMLFASYNKYRYSIHTSYSYNKFKVYDNGGIKNDIYVEDKDTLSDPGIFPTNLKNCKSVFLNTNFLFVNQYKLGKKILKQINDTTQIKSVNHKSSLIYYIDILNYRKIYNDDSSSYYRNFYIPGIYIYDSTQFDIVSNAFQFCFLPDTNNFIPIGFASIIKSDISNYSCYNIDSTYIDNSAIIKIENSKNAKIKFDFSAEYCFDGYREDDINSGLFLRKSYKSDSLIFLFNIKFSRTKPSISEILFSSTNYFWDTSFVAKDRSDLNLNLIDRKHKTNLFVNYSILDNFIYFNSDTSLVQSTSTFNVITVGFTQQTKIKRFNFNNTIIYQKSDNNEVVRLPEFCLNNSTFFEFSLLKGIINSQIGFDIYYNTSFYAYAYSTAISSFYIQNNKKIGNYPYLDFFINFKLKRARIFVKYEHANHNLIDRNYFVALHYPSQEKMMKFGISWNFYD